MVNGALPASGIAERSISEWIPTTPPGIGRIPPPRPRKRGREQGRLLFGVGICGA